MSKPVSLKVTVLPSIFSGASDNSTGLVSFSDVPLSNLYVKTSFSSWSVAVAVMVNSLVEFDTLLTVGLLIVGALFNCVFTSFASLIFSLPALSKFDLEIWRSVLFNYILVTCKLEIYYN